MKVLLINGGTSNEREVSLRSGAAVVEALHSLDYDYRVIDPSDPKLDFEALAGTFDCAFIALHGKGGEDGTIQKILEQHNIPFIGSDSVASALCFDKWEFKKLLDKHNILTPKGELVSIHNQSSKLFTKPFVLKPCDEGSSIDTLIARELTPKVEAEKQKLLETHNELLLEELIEGTEITVGVIGDEAMPLIEIIPPTNEEFDYENKYNNKTQELCPPKHVSQSLQKQAKELALKIHKLAGCRDISRTDIIIDKNNHMYVLECNTIPGLTKQSLLPKMAREHGMTFELFVDKMIQRALIRQP